MRLGIDLGGTKTEVVALDDGGTELFRDPVATDARGYAATIATVAGLVTRAQSELGQTGTVGVGILGTISARTG
jgi:fructokinase